MLPDFLKLYADVLKTYQKPCIAIEVTPLENTLSEDPLGIQQSKLMGFPFLPLSRKYPTDADGNNMYLMAQINFAEIPTLEGFPDSGLLQLYVSPQGWWEFDVQVLFITDEELQESHRSNFLFLKEDIFAHAPVSRIHQLKFETKLENGGLADDYFDIKFGDLELWEFEKSLSKADQETFRDFFYAGGHKIGGYAHFAQEDYRGKNPENTILQLLQIDYDDYISFGDGGTVHLFIDQEDLKARDFEKAEFYWDCY